jgi:RES domain-containing protein
LPQFDYLNYGSWALDGIGRITFTPAIPQQLTGYKAELYSYNADGYLVEVREAQSSYDYLTGQIIAPNLATALTRSLTSYDPMGRVTGMVEYAASGTTIAGQAQFERYAIVHDLRGQVISEKGRTRLAKQNGQFDTLYTHTVNNYSATGLGANSPAIESANAVGSSTGSILYYSETKNWLNGSSNLVYGAGGFNYSQADRDYADAYTRYSYRFYEAEVQLQVKLINRDAPLGVDSDFTYDGLGRLSNVNVGGPRAHTLNYVNDINGQVISRSVTGGPGTVKPTQYYHYYNGIMLGSNGNNGNDRPDMQTALNERIAQGPTTPGVFRNGGTGPNPYADFDQAYDAVSPETLAQGPSAYTVRSGDSLESIAAQIWGDASLWYMIAEANPSAARGNLTAGTSLIIPNKVANFHNTSDTFRPYDAEKAIGDTQPGTPKPAKANNKCGVFGQILQTIIAIAVTIIATPVIGPVGAAVLGSAVSQVFGVAVGIQDKFSFKSLAIAAISAGVTGGVGNVLGTGAVAGSQIVGDVVRGVVSNAITQGVSVATGLQDKFNWAGVATAGVAAGVSGAISREIGGANGRFANADDINGGVAKGSWVSTGSPSFTNNLISGMAGGIAAAGARSIIEGTNFGDNLIAVLPDVLASTVGRALGAEIGREIANSRNLTRAATDIVDFLGGMAQDVGSNPEEYQAVAGSDVIDAAAIRQANEGGNAFMMTPEQRSDAIRMARTALKHLLKYGEVPATERGDMLRTSGVSVEANSLMGYSWRDFRQTIRSMGRSAQAAIQRLSDFVMPRRNPITGNTFRQDADRLVSSLSSLASSARSSFRAVSANADTIIVRGGQIARNVSQEISAAVTRAENYMAPVTRTLTTIRDTAVGVYNGLDRGAAGNRASLGSLITSARDGINYLDSNFSLEGWGNAIDHFRGIPVAPGAPSPINVYNDVNNTLEGINQWADRTDARILDYLGQAALFPDKIPSDIRAAYRSARDSVSGVYEAEGIPGLAERASYYGMRTAGELAMAVVGTKGANTVLRAERGATALGIAETGGAAGVKFEGTLYRAVPEGGNPLDISFSVNASGRYTAPGQGGLYFASGSRIVEAEFVNTGSSLAGRTLHAFPQSAVDNLLDLSNPMTRRQLGVSLADVTRTGGTSAWRYQVTQPLGAYAQRNGYSGIIAPSAQADGGVNLILFGPKGVR